LLGFLYLGDLGGEQYATSGNQGLLDICDGLKWVHQNIEARTAMKPTSSSWKDMLRTFSS
jgi:hypothetical protein